MASTIIWQPTASTLETAISSANLTDKTAGQTVLAKLQATGQAYDHANTSVIRDLINAEESAHATATSQWITQTTTTFNNADRAARFLESLQVQSQQNTQLNPNVVQLEDATRYVLAPLSSLVFDATELPVRASLLLTNSVDPIARITARELGKEGALVTVEVVQASNLQNNQRNLIARRGDYFEVFENLDFSGTRENQPITNSLLIGTIDQVGRGILESIAATPLVGGVGNAQESIETRLTRAKQLPVATSVLKATIDAHLAEINNAFAKRPYYVSRLKQQEDALNAALADANAFLAYLAF